MAKWGSGKVCYCAQLAAHVGTTRMLMCGWLKYKQFNSSGWHRAGDNGLRSAAAVWQRSAAECGDCALACMSAEIRVAYGSSDGSARAVDAES